MPRPPGTSLGDVPPGGPPAPRARPSRSPRCSSSTPAAADARGLPPVRSRRGSEPSVVGWGSSPPRTRTTRRSPARSPGRTPRCPTRCSRSSDASRKLPRTRRFDRPARRRLNPAAPARASRSRLARRPPLRPRRSPPVPGGERVLRSDRETPRTGAGGLARRTRHARTIVVSSSSLPAPPPPAPDRRAHGDRALRRLARPDRAGGRGTVPPRRPCRSRRRRSASSETASPTTPPPSPRCSPLRVRPGRAPRPSFCPTACTSSRTPSPGRPPASCFRASRATAP